MFETSEQQLEYMQITTKLKNWKMKTKSQV